VPVAALISADACNGPHTADVFSKFDASPKIGAFGSTIMHHFTTLNSLTSRDCATFQTNRICSVEAQAVCSAPGATQIRTVTTNGTIMRSDLLNHRTPRCASNCTEKFRSPVCCFALEGNT
jgi:hypothetical protein